MGRVVAFDGLHMTAIIVRGHERGATRSDRLFVALTQLQRLLPDSKLFVRSWLHSDARPGTTWRQIAAPQLVDRARVCGYFSRLRMESCELEAEPRSSRLLTETVFRTPVLGQRSMWAQQLRALRALDTTTFATAISLRFDLFDASFATANGLDGLGYSPETLSTSISRAVQRRCSIAPLRCC
jgi:hypothetical protein